MARLARSPVGHVDAIGDVNDRQTSRSGWAGLGPARAVASSQGKGRSVPKPRSAALRVIGSPARIRGISVSYFFGISNNSPTSLNSTCASSQSLM